MHAFYRLHNSARHLIRTLLRGTLLISTAAALIFCALLAVPCSGTVSPAVETHSVHHHPTPAHPAAADHHCVLHSLVLPTTPAVSAALLCSARLTPRTPALASGPDDAPPQPPPQTA